MPIGRASATAKALVPRCQRSAVHALVCASARCDRLSQPLHDRGEENAFVTKTRLQDEIPIHDRARDQLRGMRHCIVQCSPVFKKTISVLPSKDLSADLSSLVPKPASPIVPIGGPSVSSQVMLSRSSDTDQDTCNSPRGEENAPYFPALVASS